MSMLTNLQLWDEFIQMKELQVMKILARSDVAELTYRYHRAHRSGMNLLLSTQCSLLFPSRQTMLLLRGKWCPGIAIDWTLQCVSRRSCRARNVSCHSWQHSSAQSPSDKFKGQASGGKAWSVDWISVVAMKVLSCSPNQEQQPRNGVTAFPV